MYTIMVDNLAIEMLWFNLMVVPVLTEPPERDWVSQPGILDAGTCSHSLPS